MIGLLWLTLTYLQKCDALQQQHFSIDMPNVLSGLENVEVERCDNVC